MTQIGHLDFSSCKPFWDPGKTILYYAYEMCDLISFRHICHCLRYVCIFYSICYMLCFIEIYILKLICPHWQRPDIYKSFPKRPVFHHACATCDELPSNTSTMEKTCILAVYYSLVESLCILINAKRNKKTSAPMPNKKERNRNISLFYWFYSIFFLL